MIKPNLRRLRNAKANFTAKSYVVAVADIANREGYLFLTNELTAQPVEKTTIGNDSCHICYLHWRGRHKPLADTQIIIVTR